MEPTVCILLYRNYFVQYNIFKIHSCFYEYHSFLFFFFFFAEYTLYWASLWFSGKESVSQTGDTGLIPGLGRFSEEGNGNPLQYSCLGNPMDRGT